MKQSFYYKSFICKINLGRGQVIRQSRNLGQGPIMDQGQNLSQGQIMGKG